MPAKIAGGNIFTNVEDAPLYECWLAARGAFVLYTDSTPAQRDARKAAFSTALTALFDAVSRAKGRLGRWTHITRRNATVAILLTLGLTELIFGLFESFPAQVSKGYWPIGFIDALRPAVLRGGTVAFLHNISDDNLLGYFAAVFGILVEVAFSVLRSYMIAKFIQPEAIVIHRELMSRSASITSTPSTTISLDASTTATALSAARPTETCIMLTDETSSNFKDFRDYGAVRTAQDRFNVGGPVLILVLQFLLVAANLPFWRRRSRYADTHIFHAAWNSVGNKLTVEEKMALIESVVLKKEE
ncbi:hypothetical protein BJ508DRAFT_331100 [Ascobolus immersus RN42]|uniref:Uncharacterized protein n=1 Tax=Ascobolus immersus RN42 TaxID=1160509 RepID=A0A3N4HV73_ASCIM|nr:hypothetical protein BJ508DRAFT_331100 [Ascobolus immersus RN42]